MPLHNRTGQRRFRRRTSSSATHRCLTRLIAPFLDHFLTRIKSGARLVQHPQRANRATIDSPGRRLDFDGRFFVHQRRGWHFRGLGAARSGRPLLCGGGFADLSDRGHGAGGRRGHGGRQETISNALAEPRPIPRPGTFPRLRPPDLRPTDRASSPSSPINFSHCHQRRSRQLPPTHPYHQTSTLRGTLRLKGGVLSRPCPPCPLPTGSNPSRPSRVSLRTSRSSEHSGRRLSIIASCPLSRGRHSRQDYDHRPTSHNILLFLRVAPTYPIAQTPTPNTQTTRDHMGPTSCTSDFLFGQIPKMSHIQCAPILFSLLSHLFPRYPTPSLCSLYTLTSSRCI